ncbi:TPR repeat-containing thioredoxin TTL1-like, partial [Olea europaea var. sylvestris]
MSHQGKSTSELRLQALSDRLRNTLSYDEEDNGVNVNKPDFRELDLGSPVSPLRHRACRVSASTATTPSSSSSSSGSVSGRSTAGVHSNPPRKSNSNSHSGELSSCSVGSSPSAVRNSNPGNTRTASGGTHQLIYSSGGSVNSPAVNVLPNGNICPSGRVLKTGMASRPTKTDVLGSGTGNYGHGSIMRGGPSSKPSVTKDSRPINYSRGLIVGGESVKRTGTYNNDDAEELKKRGNENYRKGNFAEALAFYSKAIAVSPSNAAYHFNRAATLIGLRRLAEAVRECEEAIKLDPGYVRAHHRLGSLLLSLGQVENARKHLCYPGYQADAVELQKLQAVEKHLNKCTDARRVGDWRNTLSEVDAAIASGADASPQLCACRAEALLKLLQLDDAFLAISDIPKFELSTGKIFGMLFEAYIFFVRAQIELARGRFENALTDVEKARKVDPRNVEISVMLNNVRLVGRARARGNDLFKSERFTEACSAY